MQAAPTSNAPARSAPSAWATIGAVFGVSSSWRQRRDDHQVEVGGGRRRRGSARLARRGRRSPTAARRGRATAALADAGPRHDPVLADPEALGELGGGQRAPREARSRPTERAGRAAAYAADAPWTAPCACGLIVATQAWTSSTSLSVRLASPVSTRPGPDLDEPLGAALAHRQHRLAPAHRHRQRLGELRAHVVERRGRDRGEHRSLAAREISTARARPRTRARPRPSSASGTRR